MDEAVITEHHLTVQRTARYCTLGDLTSATDIWIVCHGFGQLARAFLEGFRPVARAGRLIVAPEALNRFYMSREGGRAPNARVGATWMTKEDRLAEIEDYVRYLDDLFREVVADRAEDVRVTALGFSQGTATVSRWLVHGETELDRVILWCGLLPPEIHPAGTAHQRLASANLHLVLGARDEMMSAEQVSQQREALSSAKVPVRFIQFEGGHELDGDVLKQLAG